MTGTGWAELRDDGCLEGEIAYCNGDSTCFIAKPWTFSAPGSPIALQSTDDLYRLFEETRVSLMAEVTTPSLTELTVTLLVAFVQSNNVRSEDLPGLILSTHNALVTTAGNAVHEVSAKLPELFDKVTFEPAVSVRKSLASPSFILSMIDGKPYKSLKRHLAAKGISPDQYRERYNLPASYPMVAPEYSESRRAFANSIGLGRPRPPVDTTPPADAAAKTPRAVPRRKQSIAQPSDS